MGKLLKKLAMFKSEITAVVSYFPVNLNREKVPRRKKKKIIKFLFILASITFLEECWGII